MPNWVYNTITVKPKSHDTNAIEEFKKKYFTDNDFDYDKVIPEPKTMEECPNKYIIKGGEAIEISEDKPWFNWYEWHYDFWGCKWNASDTQIGYDTEDELVFWFSSPWSPPRKVLRELVNQNKHLQIKIESEGE